MTASVASRWALAVGCALAAAFAVAGGAWSTPLIGMLCAAVLVSVGMPHGALDLPLARRQLHGATQIAAYVFAYVASASLAYGGLLLMPALIFPSLLVIASWHFGGDYRQLLQTAGKATGAEILALGAAPLVWALLGHPATVHAYFSAVAGSAAANLTVQGITLLTPLLIALQLIAVGRVARTFHRARSVAQAAGLIDLPVTLAVTAGLFVTLEPLVAFTLYFCCIHAPRHTLAALAVLPRKRWRCAVEAIVLSAAAIGLLTGVEAALLSDVRRSEIVVLGALLALTVPHALHPLICRLLVNRAKHRPATAEAFV